MASQGTREVEVRTSSGTGVSGMRLRKTRLAAPMSALKAKRMENCQACGSVPRQKAAMTKVMALQKFAHAASRTRYWPRNDCGTSAVIQGSQAQLEIPRERLKQKRSI